MPVGLYFCAVWQASQFWWNLVSCNRSSWTTFYLSFPFNVIHFVDDYILKFHGISKIALLLQYISVNILSESRKWMTKCKKKTFCLYYQCHIDKKILLVQFTNCCDCFLFCFVFQNVIAFCYLYRYIWAVKEIWMRFSIFEFFNVFSYFSIFQHIYSLWMYFAQILNRSLYYLLDSYNAF